MNTPNAASEDKPASIDPKLVAEVARVVELDNVRLVETHAQFLSEPSTAGALALGYEFRAGWKRDDDLPGFVVRFDFVATLSEETEGVEPRPVFKFQAIYVLDYRLPERMAADWEERLAAFARLNGVVNAWPYVRADLQTTLLRAGFPSIILPVFRAGKPSEGRVTFPFTEGR